MSKDQFKSQEDLTKTINDEFMKETQNPFNHLLSTPRPSICGSDTPSYEMKIFIDERIQERMKSLTSIFVKNVVGLVDNQVQ